MCAPGLPNSWISTSPNQIQWCWNIKQQSAQSRRTFWKTLDQFDSLEAFPAGSRLWLYNTMGSALECCFFSSKNLRSWLSSFSAIWGQLDVEIHNQGFLYRQCNKNLERHLRASSGLNSKLPCVILTINWWFRWFHFAQKTFSLQNNCAQNFCPLPAQHPLTSSDWRDWKDTTKSVHMKSDCNEWESLEPTSCQT